MALKRVIVTGGTRGIGRAIAARFLAEGANVVVCGRKAPAAPVENKGRTALFVAADVREVPDVEKVVAACIEAHGGVDVLINNAGGSPYADAAAASPRFHEKIIQLNLIAPLHFAQAVNRVMQEQPSGGAIINIASLSGTRPSPGTAAYGAAKAGLINLTQTLAVEWAPKVRVNAVVAGLTATEEKSQHYGDDAAVRRVEATIPLGRLATMDDIAAPCLFLSSNEASYITGAALTVHGGGEWPAFLGAVRGTL